MLCPYCKEPNTQVIDSRTSEEGSVIRRRRKCPACGGRFTTYEKAGAVNTADHQEKRKCA